MAAEGKCFTFIWEVKNINYCYQKDGESIKSPAFEVEAIEKTKWTLIIYPRGESGRYLCYYLNREVDSKGSNEITVNYELALVKKDGSNLVCYGKIKNSFLKGKCFGYNGFVSLDDLYGSKKSTMLPDDIVRARCRIWKSDGNMTEDVQCSVRTLIGVEKRFFQWNVKNFSALEEGKKCTYEIKSIEDDLNLMSVDLSLCLDQIRFELSLLDQAIKFSTLRLSLIDISGNRLESGIEKIWLKDRAERNQFMFGFTKNKLTEENSKYLPNDTLSLFWEWTFSKGIVSEEIVEDENGCICPEVKVSDVLDVNSDLTTLLNCAADNVKSLYDEQFLSDVKLKTNTEVFPAHKFILSASSPVFKAMFSNDMKEKDNDCVHIEDLSDDTISRMLLFMYASRVEDLTWESASRLYVAADKYAILSLKNVCSSFLKDNLSPSNACEVLLLSYLHTDGDLKCVAQDYLLKNGTQITKSDEWKILLQTNAKLAAETLSLLFK